MRIIIPGGSGLIGTHLSEYFVQKGHEVIILSRNPKKTLKKTPKGTVVEQWDGKHGTSWAHLITKDTAIINLTGENIASGRWTKRKKKNLLESRINSGMAVVEAIETASEKPFVLIQSSGVGYYGPHESKEFTEEEPPGNDFLADLATKWEASTDGVEALDVRRVVTRFGVVLSPRGGALPKMSLPFKLFIGGKMGNGNQWLSWIHYKDVVRAIGFLIENKSAKGPFNVSSPNPVTNQEFAKALGKVLKRPSFFRVPGFVLKIALGEMATTLLTGQKAIPKKLTSLGFEFEFPLLIPTLADLFGKIITRAV